LLAREHFTTEMDDFQSFPEYDGSQENAYNDDTRTLSNPNKMHNWTRTTKGNRKAQAARYHKRRPRKGYKHEWYMQRKLQKAAESSPPDVY